MFQIKRLAVEDVAIQYEYSTESNPDKLELTLSNTVTGQFINLTATYKQIVAIQRGLVFNFDRTRQFINERLEEAFMGEALPEGANL